jgi:PAS domain-containing protein
MQRLAETNKALQPLLADQEDSILCPGGESFPLIPAQEGLVQSEEVQRQAMEMQRSILDAIPAHLAVLDRNGSIIFINENWRRFLGRPKGSCEYVEMGQNYIEYCELADHAFDGMGPQVTAGIRKVMHVGDAAPYSLTHPVHREEKSNWYRVTATSLGRSDVIGAVVMYQDVTGQGRTAIARDDPARPGQSVHRAVVRSERNAGHARPR